MSSYEAMRELLAIDPREPFGSLDLSTRDGSDVQGSELICILCESGYHDSEWEFTHVQECGCPCHAKRDKAAGAGK